MSHPLVAVAWDQLKDRHDISNILHEIVGQHASDLALLHLQDDLVGNVEPLMRVVSWIKVIFDLQRAYVASESDPTHPIPYDSSAIVPSELIFSTMMYLIQIKLRVFPTNTITMREFAKYRYQIAQVLLSGLRIYLLRNDFMTLEKKYNLKRSIDKAWNLSTLPEEERFLVFDLLPAAIDLLKSTESQDERRPHFDIGQENELDFAGLHYMNLPPEQFVPDAFSKLTHDNSERMAAFWLLFDTLWAAETSLVHCYSNPPAADEEVRLVKIRTAKAKEAITNAEVIRKNLFDSIFESSQLFLSSIPQGVLESLTATLLGWTESADVASTPRRQAYGKHLIQMRQPFENAVKSFHQWLNRRRARFWDSNGESRAFNLEIRRSLMDWIRGTSSGANEEELQETDYLLAPLYIVNCPSLHPVSQNNLERVLRWSSTTVVEGLRQCQPLLTIDNAFCPRCAGDVPIKWARLIEPLEEVTGLVQEQVFESEGTGSSSRHSTYSTKITESYGQSTQSVTTTDASLSSTQLDSEESDMPPVSPIHPTEARYGSLFDAITGTLHARDSPRTPVSPIAAEHSPDPGHEVPLALPSTLVPKPLQIQASKPTRFAKEPKKEPKAPKMSLTRRTTAFRERLSKPSPTASIPRNNSFIFSTTGTSLLFWSAEIPSVLRFDISLADAAVGRCCKYDVHGVEQAAAGDQRCAIISNSERGRKLYVFSGTDDSPEAEVEIEASQRNLPGVCLSVSRDDKYIAFTLNDTVQVYQVGNGFLRRVILQDQMQTYKGPSQQKAAHSSQQGPSKKPLTFLEQAQEKAGQQALIDRKLHFSSTSEELIVATHLGDHHVHLDVWECKDEPWHTSSELSRSFKFPPWTTNDGDITCVFYDSASRAAFLTAYLSKEYPVLVPIPGYGHLRTEPYGTRVIQAAQAPSGSRFAIVNGMNEIFLFDRKHDGTLNSRRMKKSVAKISSSAFKPGNIVLAIPHPNLFVMFWMKDGSKPCLRTVMVDEAEHVRDTDLRPDFEELLRDNTNAARREAASREGAKSVAELHSPTGPAELPVQSLTPVELPNTQIQELPGSVRRKR